MICPKCKGTGKEPYIVHSPLGWDLKPEVVGPARTEKPCRRCRGVGEIVVTEETVMTKEKVHVCPECGSTDYVSIPKEYPKIHCLACTNVYSAKEKEVNKNEFKF